MGNLREHVIPLGRDKKAAVNSNIPLQKFPSKFKRFQLREHLPANSGREENSKKPSVALSNNPSLLNRDINEASGIVSPNLEMLEM